MEMVSTEAFMQQIRDWADSHNADAIIQVLPEIRTPELYYFAVLCLGYVYLNDEQYDKAEDWLGKVEGQGRMTGVWNYRMAVALMHQLRLQEALPYAEQAVRVEPEYIWGWLVYSEVLYGMGKSDEALQAARKGLELNPENEDFGMLIEDIEAGVPFADLLGIDEGEDYEEDEEEDEEGAEVGTFCASVLLNTVEVDMKQILSDLKEQWGIEPERIVEDDGFGNESIARETFLFHTGGMIVAVSFVPEKMPDEEVAYFANENYMWNEVMEVTKTQQAHIVVMVCSSDRTCIEGGKLFVKVVSACLKQPNAIGVFSLGTVYQPEFYNQVADMMKADEELFPIPLLVFFGLNNDESGNNVYTCGMETFGKDEVEIVGSSRELHELQSVMFDVVSYLIEADGILLDGETLELEDGQEVQFTRSEGVFVDGESLKIGY